MKLPVYLDNHSTTPVDPQVFSAMEPYFKEKFGNASSKGHSFGWEAESAVEKSRKTIAEFIGASPAEIYFTSGTTEAINILHFGIAESYSGRGTHIITSSIEHSAVLDSLRFLEKKGFSVTYLPVDEDGFIKIEQLERSIISRTILVSIMTANNEIGVINNLDEIGKICRTKGVLFHTDAAQGIGKTEFNAADMNISAASFSAHKIYGPKGTGALYLKKGIKITPQFYGGGQEKGLRPGTLNTPGIVGFGKAVEIYGDVRQKEEDQVRALRDNFYKKIISHLDGVHLNGKIEGRLYNNINLRFDGIRSEDLLLDLRDLALSTGSACASESVKPSHVLKAIGLNDAQARSSIRIGLGRFNTQEEIEYAANRIIESVNKLRSFSPITKIKVS